MKLANVDEQYKKHTNLKKEEVLKLVEWNKQQPHLPEVIELMACCFLHACMDSLEVAKQTYDLYCTTKTMCPEFFSNLDITGKELTEMMKTIAYYPLPGLTPQGLRVCIIKLIDFDPSKFIFPVCIKLCMMCMELTQHEEGVSDGSILVLDLKGAQVGHIGCLSPLVMKKLLFFLQECRPQRSRSVHFINCAPFIDKAFSIMRPFLKKEVQSRILVHTNIDTFYEHVPKEFLPIEYGGDGISYEKFYPEYYSHVRESKDFFIWLENAYRTNEKLRPGKPKSESEIFGVEGNFKKLDID